jgi:hypothetical protein
MADASRSGNALGWLVLGFLAGVAATLAVLTFLTPPHTGRRSQPSEATSTAPEPRISEKTSVRPSVKPAPSSAPAPALAAANAADQQVQEDAAAAGMTSRRPSSSAPASN